MAMKPDYPIYLFAKAPEPGKVKTRLCPPLNARSAAAVAEYLLESSLDILVPHWPGRVVLTVAPDATHPVFQRLLSQYPISVEVQVNRDLGGRMQHVLEQGIAESSGAAVVGCDIPDLSGTDLQAAWDALCAGQHAVGPTYDGGFYLLACCAFEGAWFDNVAWGTEHVLAQLVKNMQHTDTHLERLAQHHDLDVADDLYRVARQRPGLRRWLPDN